MNMKYKIELISGQKFPDIITYIHENKAYGIEIKTTKQNKWTTVGSSIFEGTRVEGVEKIYLLFAKLTKPIEFKYRLYEECLSDVVITHSPRYLINMDLKNDENIFSKIGIEYNEFIKLDKPFSSIKKHLRSNLKDGDEIWWIDNHFEELDNPESYTIKLWTNLSTEEKNKLTIDALVYFPSLFGNDPNKYSHLATWLVAKHKVVNHALRDTFSAGGKYYFNKVQFPKIYKFIFENLADLEKSVRCIDDADITYYWKKEISTNKLKTWLNMFKHYSKYLNKQQYNVLTEYLLSELKF